MKYMELPINKVELDKENPRIKHFLSIYSGELTSENLSLALTGLETSKYVALRDSIKANKGIFTPIIVNHITKDDRYVVIEGNTRLKFYQEFDENKEDGNWKTIISIVYDDMSDDEIHAIRLQAHMVGARDWDAFSKAKYLAFLYNDEKKPMEYLKNFCGGQESYIRSLINAYQDMIDFYIPVQEELGEEFDPNKFSYYVEAQKNSCKEALIVHGYDMRQFSKWVINEKIDRAEAVRKLAKVLGEEEPRKVFLSSTLTDAIKKLDSKSIDQKKLEKTDLYKMIHELTIRLRNLPYKELEHLKLDPKYYNRKEELIDLYTEVVDVYNQIGDDE